MWIAEMEAREQVPPTTFTPRESWAESRKCTSLGGYHGLTDGVLGGFQVLVLAVKQLFPEFEFMWLVDEAKKNLPLELDFLNEGRNAEKVAQMLKHFDFLKV
jgi:hypothetical protein